MNILLARKGRGFLPGDPEAAKLHAKLVDGEVMLFKAIKVRSLPWHRMYFGICSEIGKNQDPQREESSIDYELRIRAGHFDILPIHGAEGIEIRIPKRIAFEKLTADEWSALWPSLELAIRETFGAEYIAWKAA